VRVIFAPAHGAHSLTTLPIQSGIQRPAWARLFYPDLATLYLSLPPFTFFPAKQTLIHLHTPHPSAHPFFSHLTLLPPTLLPPVQCQPDADVGALHTDGKALTSLPSLDSIFWSARPTGELANKAFNYPDLELLHSCCSVRSWHSSSRSRG